MTTFNFSITVPEDIVGNKDWFNFIADISKDMSDAYRDCATDADNLPETHPFYASMLPQDPIPETKMREEISIPTLLKNAHLDSLEALEGPDGSYYITLEGVRLAIENCLQDYQVDYMVSIKGGLFIIESSPCFP